MKLIGIITSIVILNQATGIGAEQMKYFANIVKITLTQSETDSIAYMIYTDKVIGGENRIPYFSEDEWAEYIRKNMESKVKTRDTSKDLWEKSYEVIETDPVPGRDGIGFIVRSKGPDGSAETKDDVFSSYTYR